MQGTQPSWIEQADEGLAAERARAFWLFQAIFWGANLAIRSFAALQYRPELALGYLGPRAVIVAAELGVTALIGLALWRTDRWPAWRRWALALGLCVLAMAPLNLLEEALARRVEPTWPGMAFVEYVAQFGWVFLMWAGYFFAQDYGYQVRRQAAEVARAQAAAHDARLKMLRYQLNPHFLFNTLNAISTLVLDRRVAEAEGMILSLSRFLRHTIDTDPAQLTPLGVEADIQRLYLEIEKARFGDRLTVSCAIEPDARGCLVPSLLIQPLVENAIKFAVAPNAKGGRIDIGGYERAGQLVLYVADDGPGLDATAAVRDHGVGLRNIRERLEAAFSGQARMTFGPGADGRGLRVEITLPAIRSTA